MEGLISDIEILNTDTEREKLIKNRPLEDVQGQQKKLYIESYGCQMNFSDSEIVASILKDKGITTTSEIEEADLIFLNTCSIRDKAEQTIRKRLRQMNSIKILKPEVKVGLLGCMAERLKTKLLDEEKIVDIVAGPDAYRDLPNLVNQTEDGQKAVNTFLSKEETYANINPVRLNSNGVTAFISIMRGCNNMCSFCVVPFTRGRERSRDPYSIIDETKRLFDQGYREVTLLGQNVDSYNWSGKRKNGSIKERRVSFAQLLEKVALVSPGLRIRFSTSHPKDITDDVLYTMKTYENICKNIHLPAQSGNSRILKLMNRTYDRNWYLKKVDRIREILGDECCISSDMIAGFCSESEEEHKDTLSLMDYVKYNFSYMFIYSERPGTPAAKNLKDNIPLTVKRRRLQEIIDKQQTHSLEKNKLDLNKIHKVLIEGPSRRSDKHFQGRNSANKVVVFPKKNYKKGQYVNVRIENCTAATLIGKIVN